MKQNYEAYSGGRPWPQYVAQYGGLKIYNYAAGGATCDATLIPQENLSNSQPFPDVKGYEVPTYLAEKTLRAPESAKPFLDVPTAQTVYSIWIGTNDVGANGFVADTQSPGANLTSYLDCVYAQVGRLYESGARFFVLQTLAPLQLSPQYGNPATGGLVGSTFYWADKPNATLIWQRMTETVATVNSIYHYRTESEVVAQEKYPGAHFAVFDVEGLLGDIYSRPAVYLNGTTVPLNVTAPDNKCNHNKVCVRGSSPDSYLWYDDLHPSEQAGRVVAREFIGVLGGKSKWAKYNSGSPGRR